MTFVPEPYFIPSQPGIYDKEIVKLEDKLADKHRKQQRLFGAIVNDELQRLSNVDDVMEENE